MNIVDRYFFRKAFIGTLIYLTLFAGIIILIDAMIHIRDILDKKTSLEIWGTYYLCLLAKRLDVLVPYSIGIATVHLLTQSLKRHELIPLLNAGRSLNNIFKPLFASSLLFAFGVLLHYQLILPSTLPLFNQIESSDFGRHKITDAHTGVGQILLDDGTRLLFSDYSKSTNELHGVILLSSSDSLSYMNTLKLTTPVEALYLQEFQRDPQGSLRLIHSFTSKELPEIQIEPVSLLCSTAPPKELSVRQLLHIFPKYWTSQSERSIDIQLNLFQKLTQPLLCILATCIPILVTVQFGRKVRVYSLFVTAAFIMLVQIILQAFTVLARTSTLDPVTALLLPWIGIGIYSYHRYKKLTSAY